MSVMPLPREDEDQAARAKPKKAPTAFRTISEVADDLHIPQHVLRFWETKFTQVKPLKRGGGRRYYRPDDITLLRRISHLLYTQGYTIKGVQRLLREGGGRLPTISRRPARRSGRGGRTARPRPSSCTSRSQPAGEPPNCRPNRRAPPACRLRFIPRSAPP